MLDAAKRKLELHARLSADDRAALEDALGGRTRKLDARRDIIEEGAHCEQAYFVLSGWACRYKILEDGRRQTMALMIEGDLCDLSCISRIDHSIETVTQARIAEVPAEVMAELAGARPRLASAFRRAAIVDEAIGREWIVSLGQRSAPERMAHLFCEIFTRCRLLGLAHGGDCPMPLTQIELAAALGLSIVHVNRTLKELRASSLILLHGKRLAIPSFERLRSLALFDPSYLHVGGEAGGRPHELADAPCAV